jgi:hypothetical protein
VFAIRCESPARTGQPGGGSAREKAPGFTADFQGRDLQAAAEMPVVDGQGHCRLRFARVLRVSFIKDLKG